MEAIIEDGTEQKQTPVWLLELYGGEPSDYQKTELAGAEWWHWNSIAPPKISCHIHEDGGRLRLINCHQDDKGAFAWKFSLLVAEGQYVRAHGEAETLLQAAEAALAYTPDEMECGGVAWFREQGEAERWVGWVNGDCVLVCGGEKAYCWSRGCAEAEDLLMLCNSFRNEFSGGAATREEAMQAAIDAPNKLRELAAKFVLGKPVEEAYSRGVVDGREEMRSAIKATINCIRLLPSEKVKAKAA
ncbi:MAG: hypothetical protein F9K21_00455 [Rhodocyclaceae bacterium]|nr:MAG: hypothetical protein F9K21_00455 [Rhodocyclaceae bacterium]CAG0926945.1 hypothetical protein RHDC3_00229 [Rhodocyclaceae bacterium]